MSEKKLNPLDPTTLRWVRIFDPVHIPKKYIEMIKDRDFSVEKFYTYQKHACLIHTPEGQQLNPLNLLYVLADEENVVKGVCWMVVDALCDALVINTYVVDKEYWKSKKCVQILQDKALEIKEGAKLERIYWITPSAKHSENHGFKRCRQVLMEYKTEIKGINKDDVQMHSLSRDEESGRIHSEKRKKETSDESLSEMPSELHQTVV